MNNTLIQANNSPKQYSVKLNSRAHQIIADEPEEIGGADTGMAPYELLASSLAACTCITLRMYADRKSMLVGEINVSVGITKNDSENTTRFHRVIAFTAAVTAEDRARLLVIANKCPIHKTLGGTIDIATEIIS